MDGVVEQRIRKREQTLIKQTDRWESGNGGMGMFDGEQGALPDVCGMVINVFIFCHLWD